MRISLLTKFSLSFLITGIVLVGILISLIQFYAFQNFSDYVAQTEYNQLNDLTRILEAEYKDNKSWIFLTDNHHAWQKIMQQAGFIPDDGRPLPPPGIQEGPPGRPSRIGQGPLFQGLDQNRFQPPPPGPPRPRDNNLGHRVTLLDKDKKLVMGRYLTDDTAFLRPFPNQEAPIGFLGFEKAGNLSHPLDLQFLKQQKNSFYIAGALFLLCSVITSFLLAFHLLSPIRKLSRATRALGKRQFNTRISLKTTDELGMLAEDFNRMATTLGDYELQQIQWISDISHELRTPLTILLGELEAVQDGIRKLDKGSVDSLHSEVRHLIRLVNDLHDSSMAEGQTMTLNKTPTDAGKLLEQTMARFKDQFNAKEIQVKTNLPEGAIVLADPDRLIQIFSNLLKNCLAYTDSPGRMTMDYQDLGNEILFTFDDSPPGVPSHLRPRLFDRLFRAERSRNRQKGGSGLGLGLCRHITDAHGGDIQVRKSSIGGLGIDLRLPKITTDKGGNQ